MGSSDLQSPRSRRRPSCFGDFGPAHGSQPGAQAGRHALEGREDLEAWALPTKADLDLQKWRASPTCKRSLTKAPYKMALFGAKWRSLGSLRLRRPSRKRSYDKSRNRLVYPRPRAPLAPVAPIALAVLIRTTSSPRCLIFDLPDTELDDGGAWACAKTPILPILCADFSVLANAPAPLCARFTSEDIVSSRFTSKKKFSFFLETSAGNRLDPARNGP